MLLLNTSSDVSLLLVAQSGTDAVAWQDAC
jgi:hypothetical protein